MLGLEVLSLEPRHPKLTGVKDEWGNLSRDTTEAFYRDAVWGSTPPLSPEHQSADPSCNKGSSGTPTRKIRTPPYNHMILIQPLLQGLGQLNPPP